MSEFRRSPGLLMNLAIIGLVMAIMAFAAPHSALATNGGTSAGATIHNLVTVTYQLGSSGTVTAYGTVDVTVLTVPTTPTWTAATGKSVAGGSFTTYSSSLRSNANGPDSYTITQSVAASSGASSQTGQTLLPSEPLSVVLWGGITSQAAAAGVLYFPGGSLGINPIAPNSIVDILGTKYVVGVAIPGTKDLRDGSVVTIESFDQLPVTPVSGLPAEAVGTGISVPAGTQIGEVKKIGLTLTAGTPTVVGTPGYDNTGLSAVGAATDKGNSPQPAATASIQTTITSAALTITKKSRIISSGVINGTANIDTTAYTTGTKSARSGETIEYLVTVSNAAGNTLSNNINISDPTPKYTHAVSGSQSVGTAANAATTITGVTTVVDGSAVWSGTGYPYPSALAGGNSLHIIYQVTVD